MFTHRIWTRTASAAIPRQRRVAVPVGRHSQRMELHTTAPTSIKAFPEVDPKKKMPHTPTSVAEREMIRKTEKNAHSDMDEMRPPKTEKLKTAQGEEPPPKDPSTRETSTTYIQNARDDLQK
mmetsp:Transcript_22275/g.42298  ORF Transcript_22275/g.42298 Transcript_22275/m.42298 type:complete len:122 (+) Transcript_22275:52-417(+)